MSLRLRRPSLPPTSSYGSFTRPPSSLNPNFPPLSACLYYILSSTTLTLLNKALFYHYPFQHHLLLLASQSLVAMLVLFFLSSIHFITLPPLSIFTRPAFIRYYTPFVLCYLVTVATSLGALRFTTLLMYNTLRRTSVLFVLILQSLVNTSRPGRPVIISVAVILAGALYAAKADIVFDPTGYASAFLANLAGAGYLILIPTVRSRLGIDNASLLWINALVIFTAFGTLALVTGDARQFWTEGIWRSRAFATNFVASCALSLVINHAVYVNTTANSPLTQCVSGQLKDVMMLLTSWVFFDRKVTSRENLVGVTLSFLGSLIYAIAKYGERQSRPSPSRPDYLSKSHSEKQSGRKDPPGKHELKANGDLRDRMYDNKVANGL